MIIKQTTIIECYCDKCGHGQLKTLLDIGFTKQKTAMELVGTQIKCEKCEQFNVIEDCYSLIPQSFIIGSTKEYHKIKSENGVERFLNSDEDGK